MKKILIPLLLFCFGFLHSQNAYLSGKISPFTAALLASLEEVHEDSTQLHAINKRFALKNTNNRNYINAYLELANLNSINLLEAYQVKINSIIGNVVTAQIPVDIIEELAEHEEIERIEAAMPISRRMDKARPAGNVDKVLLGTDLGFPYKGKDVVIGIIDGGFDYGHINFYNEDLSELRIKRVWNQNVNERDGRPAGYTYGKEYATEEDILKAQYDYDTETHGTHVAGIAAGGDFTNDNI